MTHLIAYLDEFGHIGPYISRTDKRYQESPIFGLGGFVIPANRVRGFATWFFQRKNELLEWEVTQSKLHPAVFEKKGSALYTTKNIDKYPELSHFTRRLYRTLPRFEAKVFYVGQEKRKDPGNHKSDDFYMAVLREAIKRLNQHAEELNTEFMMVLDEHSSRDRILTTAGLAMFGDADARRLIEPPFQVESHRFQTIQCADWICGLLGRLGVCWKESDAWQDMSWAQEKFQKCIVDASIRSGIKSQNYQLWRDYQGVQQ